MTVQLDLFADLAPATDQVALAEDADASTDDASELTVPPDDGSFEWLIFHGPCQGRSPR